MSECECVCVGVGTLVMHGCRVSKALWRGFVTEDGESAAVLIMSADVLPFQRLFHLPIAYVSLSLARALSLSCVRAN